jgi:hypothetical protein
VSLLEEAGNYWLTLTRLRVLDAMCGPEPDTEAERQRIRERERLERALPNPQAELAPNWHLEVIAAKLMEVRRGGIR